MSKPLYWKDAPKHLKSGKCIWTTKAFSRYRVVEHFVCEDEMETEWCEAQFKNPFMNEKWVTLSCHKNPLLAMRACGRHHSR